MNANLTGPMEARLLALERRQAQVDRSLRDLDRQLVAAQQGTWDAWSGIDLNGDGGGGSQPPPQGGKIPGCSSPLAATLYAQDPVYGSITLQWDGSSMWTACKVVNFPGFHSSCPATSGVAVFYDVIAASGQFRMRWKSNFPTTTACPTASTCSDTSNCSANQNLAITVDSCTPFQAHQTCGTGGGFIIFGNAVDTGVKVLFSDSPL
jgi:hypothetical protein